MASNSSTSVQSAASSSIKLPRELTGPWTLADLKAGRIGTPRHGLRVFTTFHCGGGSSMGYRLAGFDVVGGVELDPAMMAIYRQNHNPDPRLSFLMGISEFNELFRSNPIEGLHGIDVLDGSPPCSTFSTAGNREEDWGKKKRFKEGQAEQVLDDLFFRFIDTVELLRPRIVVAENVKGMLIGNAKGYVAEINSRLKAIGYEVQIFLLNAAAMGVPQARERVFFIARRSDDGLPRFDMSFNEPPIGVERAIAGAGGERKPLSRAFKKWWDRTPPGMPFSHGHPKGSFFNTYKLHPDRPANTVMATVASLQAHWSEPSSISPNEIVRLQSFPDDYEFTGSSAKYVCGMSVPPLMVQRIALRIAAALLASRGANRRPKASSKCPFTNQWSRANVRNPQRN